MLRIKLIRSPIGANPKNRGTIQALGLRKIHQEVVKEDGPCLRGQIQMVKESLIVTDEETGKVLFDGRTTGPRTRKDKKPSETH